MTRRASSVRSLVLALLLGVAAEPASAQYSFTAIAQSINGFDPFSFGRPALNVNGAVAFTATAASDPNGGSGITSIFRAGPGGLTTIATTETDFDRFGDVSINALGQVGFEGSFATVRGEGIFRGDGISVVTIAGTRNAGIFDFVNAGPSLNAVGQVAFIGALEVGFVDGVFVGSGGPVTTLYDRNGPVDSFNGNPSLNDGGYVAFAGTGANNGPEAIFLGNGGPLTIVADDSDGFFTVFSQPSLNESNQVAFSAGLNGFTESGLFLYRGGVLDTIARGNSGQFFSFSDASLNNLGQVAYLDEPFFGSQVLRISAGLPGSVISTGDVLFGRTIQSIVMSRESLNDLGQVAFTAFFDDGSAGVFLATPTAVPEPTTVALLAGALPLVLLGARRARRRRTPHVAVSGERA